MLRDRTLSEVESDLAALRQSAERAGMALACLFSTADEYEASVIRERRAAGALPPQTTQRHRLRHVAWTLATAVVFLMI